MKTDKRLPYTEISDDFIPPRDPVLGYVKVGAKDSTIRYTRAGKPWVAPTRLLDPARFEVTTREKRTKKVKGQGNASSEEYTVDLGYVRDEEFHGIPGVGSAPNSLRVRLLYPRWNQNLKAFLGAYGRGEWVCRGNGVEATDIKRGGCVCPCPRLAQFSGKYSGPKLNDGVAYKDGNTWKKDGLHPCKPHAQLNVLLEDIGVFGGFWAFKTTSFETISNLTKSLRIFEEMFRRVDGLPLELRVMAATKQIPGGGTTTQPIVTLVLAASMDTARQVAADAAAESRKFLPAGRELDHDTYLEAVVSEMEEEAESYAGEFMPEGEVLEGEVLVEAIVEATEPEGEDGPLKSNESTQMAPDEGSTDAPTLQGQPAEETDPHPDEVLEGEVETIGPNKETIGPKEETAAQEDLDPGDGEPAGDSDRNDPKSDGSDLATKVLAAAGWEKDAIQGRLEYHLRTGTLEKLLERLERGEPEAWAKVTAPDLFEGEPEDGLVS